jgi:DNA-binding NarL/FixJ family response regulator
VPFRSLSQLKLADVLSRRGHPDDVDRARVNLASAAATMSRLGMTSTLAEANALGTRLRRAADRSAALTSREREVLALLARGASNRSIAAALVISERAAEYHVANVLAKIGVTNRTEAAELGPADRIRHQPVDPSRRGSW